MRCWICYREARGGCDPRYAIGDPRRYPIGWVFCSRRCQDVFHTLYGQISEATAQGKEMAMKDPSTLEQAAMRSCLKALGEVAGSLGFCRPIGDYSEAEALRLIDAIISCYTEARIAQQEGLAYPPVQGLSPARADPLAALEDPLPWEKG